MAACAGTDSGDTQVLRGEAVCRRRVLAVRGYFPVWPPTVPFNVPGDPRPAWWSPGCTSLCQPAGKPAFWFTVGEVGLLIAECWCGPVDLAVVRPVDQVVVRTCRPSGGAVVLVRPSVRACASQPWLFAPGQPTRRGRC
jgi:hypothetical protein